MSTLERFLIATLYVKVDLPRLQREVTTVVNEYEKNYSGKVDLSKPYNIVLSESPNHEQEQSLVSYEKVINQAYFDRENEATLKKEYANTAFSNLVEELPFPFSIFRLSVLPPNTIIGMHTDESCHAQLAITTNQDCFVAARSGETEHIPSDGKLYIISTTLAHTAFNASPERRIHISISIFDDDYTDILRSESPKS